MKNINFIKITLGFVLLMGISSGCLEEELAFDVVESPVLALFDDTLDDSTGILSVRATFYELDKSGILDHTIGIDSTLLTGLPIEVYINESQLMGTFTTDSNGEVLYEEDFSAVGTAGRLEWVGSHKGVSFRIYKNL